VISLWAGQFRVHILPTARDFSLLLIIQTSSGPQPACCSVGWVLSHWQSSWTMKLSTHLCLVLRLRVSRTVHLFHLYAFMACTAATLCFLPLSYFLLASSAQIHIHFFYGGSEIFSVGLYHVVNFMFFLTAYLVIKCLIRYVCCVLCCLLLCNVYAGSLIRSEIKQWTIYSFIM
jgi:hypothetical protein